MNLEDIYFFKNLDEKILENIKEYSTIIKYSKENIIFYEGDDSKYLHLLVKGIVKLYKSGSNNKEIVMKYFYDNELIAELSNFEQIPYPATALAYTDCEILKIDFEKFRKIIYSNEELALKIQASLIKKIKNLERIISSQLVLDTHQRVAKYIVENKDDFFKTKNILIAQLLNITPETLSRVLRNFKDNGYINIKNKSINTEELILLYN
ncbi:Crp/Fnr family transcriptional regulator [Malaciobacter mytili]|uniref:Crp/Fnr family transcriptional regulator n=1 Tax=Malaciobacter mytili LMG 24559 TaxID=1032238 RepID=A0AAX2AKR0_9BACT|nr:Crp/Fnr family transcriptional regulator [Malaciobacter mytili]AXH14075.1 transcriptional regulator, Crp/Fnr family [Malaciobacter mytili LMG 24559]RXI46729.1 Crp/Fnr family transcriptional regulator [Malaciobacter mytili]RXK16954.1 Crp/Fnr family transcriptional regulator [Malaciobacter mytili LMG 24559]